MIIIWEYLAKVCIPRSAQNLISLNLNGGHISMSNLYSECYVNCYRPNNLRQFSGPPSRHSLSDTGKQMYCGELGGEIWHYGSQKNDEKRCVFIQILRFFHQSGLISKENHCLLSLHDDFDYYSSDFFFKLLKKKIWCGWGERPSVCDPFDVISNVLGALRTIQRDLNSIYTDILSSSR